MDHPRQVAVLPDARVPDRLPDRADVTPQAGDGADWDLLLLRLRHREGRVVELAGNRPVLLDDPAAVWVVFRSHVEVFAVRLDQGRPGGARRHLFRAESGVGLFGLDLQGQAMGLLAVGAPGTQLLRVERANLARLADTPECASTVARLAARWVDLLATSIGHDPWPPDLAPLRDGRLPDPSAGAASALADAPAGTSAWRAGGGRWDDLDRVHGRVLTSLAADYERRRHAERARHDERARTDRARVQAAVGRLVGAVAPRSSRRRTAIGQHDPLFAACALVGEALGIPLKPGPAPGAAGGDAPIQAIARASHLRTRRVALRGAWWTRASGPFVGYRAEDGHPVALLPGARGYQLHDPVDGTVTPVTAAVAASLGPSADTFYTRFDDRPLSALALMSFGLRGARHDLLGLLALSLVVGAIGLLTPIVTGVLFDLVIPGGHRLLLLQLGAWLAAGALAAALVQVARDGAILRLSGRLQATVEPAIVDRLLDLPVTFFRRYLAGDLAGRILAVSTVRETLTGPLLSTLLSAVFGMFSIVLLFVYEPCLALVATGLIGVLVAVLAASTCLQLRYQRRIGERAGRLAGTVLQLIDGVSRLRAAGAEPRAFAFWVEQFAEQRRIAYRARTVSNGLAIFVAAYPLLVSMVLFGVVALAGEPGLAGLSVGAFLAFNAAFGQLMGAALSLVQASTAICQVAPACERARPILQARPEVDAPRADPGQLRGAIEVERVSFRYGEDGPLVLDDVSLECRPGELVALVGPSGSGKSTLLRLLLGFEAPAAGAILYDGRDLAKLDARAVRRQIGTVLQEGRLLSGDILSNIVGASTLTLADTWEAARLAGLDEEIRQLPMGMQTVLTEGAGTLSGGQRQRLMIARAIVHRPRALFFDEATSALDNRTQEIVARSLEHLAATRLVVAHRLSTVVNADRIYVLERGRVVESGTFPELMQRQGLFAALARRQLVGPGR
jgi:ATP-binding cassette subfamily C protein